MRKIDFAIFSNLRRPESIERRSASLLRRGPFPRKFLGLRNSSSASLPSPAFIQADFDSASTASNCSSGIPAAARARFNLLTQSPYGRMDSAWYFKTSRVSGRGTLTIGSCIGGYSAAPRSVQCLRYPTDPFFVSFQGAMKFVYRLKIELALCHGARCSAAFENWDDRRI
jgi:hypothetical protein